MNEPQASAPSALRIVYCGMFGTLSRLPLATLLDQGYAVQAVVVPAAPAARLVEQLLPPPTWHPQPTSLAEMKQRTIVDLAWERDLPVIAVTNLREAAIAAIAAYAPDLIVVSCFPYRFSATLRGLPRYGILNLHPTLLPKGRGSDPLFWLFREPDAGQAGAGGVTVHLMDEELDAGPIVVQCAVKLLDGSSMAEAELRLAAAGATALEQAVAAVATGSIAPVPQDETAATMYPNPSQADYCLTAGYSAQWLFNCLRGLAGGRVTPTLLVGDQQWAVRAALSYDPVATLPGPYRLDGERLQVQCLPGVLIVAVETYSLAAVRPDFASTRLASEMLGNNPLRRK